MAMWKSVSLLCMVLQLLLSGKDALPSHGKAIPAPPHQPGLLPARADDVKPPNLFPAPILDSNDTLQILCNGAAGDIVEAIEIGTGSAPPSSHVTPNTLARIIHGNQIITYQHNVLGISGQLNSTLPYLGIGIYKPGCRYDGPIYCKLIISPATFVSSSANISVCDNLGQIAVTEPHASDPTNFVVTCNFNTNMTSEGNVTYVALQRQLRGQSEQEGVAFMNATEHGGQARTFPNFTERYVHVIGGIDQSQPFHSIMKVEFDPGTCGESGIYTCLFRYSVSGSAHEVQQMANAIVPDACAGNCLASSVRPTRTGDPTDFDLSCWTSSMCPPSSSVINQELSVVNADRTHTLLAFKDRRSSQPETGLYSSYSDRNVTVVSELPDRTVWKLAIRDGSCKDAGTYQCKMLYLDNANKLRTMLTEAKFSACLPGALVNVLYKSSSTRTLTCRADPNLATTLMSLEISIIADLHRILLVSIDAYLNNGSPIQQYDRNVFSYSGVLYPTNVANSYLNMDVHVESNLVSYTVSCKAVYATGTGDIRESFADTTLNWRP